MKRVRANVAIMLVLALALSSWTNTAFSCAMGNSSGMMGMADVSTSHHESAKPSGHAAHALSGASQHATRHEGARTDDMSPTHCPNCFDCVVLCSMAGANVTVNAPFLTDPLSKRIETPTSSVADLNSDPPPQSLFRPPISRI
jgi:hypothetical protein